MSRRKVYALQIIALSALFTALTAASLTLFGIPLSWLQAGIIVAVFTVADGLLLLFTAEPTLQKDRHADPTQSAH